MTGDVRCLRGKVLSETATRFCDREKKHDGKHAAWYRKKRVEWD